MQDSPAILEHCQDRSSGSPGGLVMIVLDDADLTHMLNLRATTLAVSRHDDAGPGLKGVESPQTTTESLQL